MNSIKWLGDETADDLPDRLHTLYKAISDERYAVQETVLVKELYHGLNGHGRAYETTNNSYEYIGPTSSLGAERDRVAGVSTDNQFAEQFRNLYRYTE